MPALAKSQASVRWNDPWQYKRKKVERTAALRLNDRGLPLERDVTLPFCCKSLNGDSVSWVGKMSAQRGVTPARVSLRIRGAHLPAPRRNGPQSWRVVPRRMSAARSLAQAAMPRPPPDGPSPEGQVAILYCHVYASCPILCDPHVAMAWFQDGRQNGEPPGASFRTARNLNSCPSSAPAKNP